MEEVISTDENDLKKEKQLTQKINSFFIGMNVGVKYLSEVRKIYNKQVAFDFTSLNFFEPDENKISEILAFFLDPFEVHGQGKTFLEIFLKKYVECKEALTFLNKTNQIIVELEKYTAEQRRIDITITFGNKDFIIGIENKIWNAQEQENQVKDYVAFLKESSNDNYILLYLSNVGEPTPYSITDHELQTLKNEKKFKWLDFRNDIIDLFNEFELNCLADNVRAFIKDFVRYLKNNFTGERIMGENDIILNTIFEKSENIELALKILSNQSALKEKLLKRLDSKIKEFSDANHLNYTIQTDFNKLQKADEDIFSFYKKEWPEGTFIFFGFVQQNMKGFIYGMRYPEQKDFLTRLRNNYKFESQCEVHCYSHDNAYTDWNNINRWLDIVTPDKSQFLKSVFERVLKILKHAEDAAKEIGLSL